MLLVGWQEGHLACNKNWVVRCWHGCLSGARCRFACGPVDVISTHCLLLLLLLLLLLSFYSSLDFVWDNPGEPVPENIHLRLSWSSIIPYLLPASITIHAILLFSLHGWRSFCAISVQVFFGLPLFLTPPLPTPYISSPNHWLLFAAHAYTIANCFAVVPNLCHLIIISQPFTWNSIF